MKNIIAIFFLSLTLLFTISCSYMKTDLGDETIDVSITQIKTSSGDTGVILSFNTVSSNLEIPDIVQGLPVLKLSFSKTSNMSNLFSIAIPSSVTEIDTFKGATSLENVELPNSITNLPSFSGCTKLKSVIIPETITEIPESCFENCKALKSVSKPTTSDSTESGESLNGIKEIGKSAFSNCSALKTIALETTSITNLNEQTFYNCSLLSTITLPETIQSVASEAFSGCTALTEVNGFELITSLASVNTKIFNSCKNLSSITVNTQVEVIPADMFNGCTSIRTFIIPENVTEIGSSAFAATSLEELYCYSSTPPKISKTSLPEMKVEEEKKTEDKKESTTDEEKIENSEESEKEVIYKKVFTLYIPNESESLYKEKWDDLVDWRVIDIKTLPKE